MREAEIVGMLKGVLVEFSGELEGRKVFLFGSRASGVAGERSDFDIGVIGEEPLPLKIYYKMEDKFDDLPTLYRIIWVDSIALQKGSGNVRSSMLECCTVGLWMLKDFGQALSRVICMSGKNHEFC